MSSIEYINSTVLTTSTANVTFSNIPQNYTDLIISCSVKSVTAATLRGGAVSFNSDPNTNYSATILYGTGSAVGSIRFGNDTSARCFGDIPTTGFQLANINIFSYSNININKTFLSEYGSAISGDTVGPIVGLYRSTSAITSITFIGNDSGADSFDVGSRFILWGVK